MKCCNSVLKSNTPICVFGYFGNESFQLGVFHRALPLSDEVFLLVVVVEVVDDKVLAERLARLHINFDDNSVGIVLETSNQQETFK